MPRFHVPPEQIRGKGFVLLGSEARHAALVLRKKIGDVLDLFDGRNLSFQGRIDFLTAERIEGTILSQEQTPPSTLARLTLCQALIKGSRWDWLVEKASEIGVSELVPLLTARTVIKPSRGTALDRWKRIALAASKQCGRPDTMVISPVLSLDAALDQIPSGDLTLIPWEKESLRTIHEACLAHLNAPAHILIGPEGGWESGEIERATRHGAIPIHLGPTLLRSETAGLVAATLVLRELGAYS